MVKETIGGQTIEFEVRHISNPTKQKSDDFQETSDRWLFIIKGETFDYYTGVGHREFKRTIGYGHSWDRRTFEQARHKNLTENGFKHFLECSTPKPPELKGLLYSLLSDSSANDRSFDDWCGDYVYENDSIKAQQIYFDCQKNGSKLHKLGLDMGELREELEDY